MDSKGYGIATKKGTPYKDLLDYAILKLMEGGTLHKLRLSGGSRREAVVLARVKEAGEVLVH